MKIQNYFKLLNIPFVLVVLHQSAQEMDCCLIGNWKVYKAQLQQFFTQSSAQAFSNPCGNISMSLKPNGTGQYLMNNLKLISNPGNSNELKVSMSMDGLYTFKWSSASNRIALNQQSNNIKTTGWIETARMKIAIPPINHNQYGSTGLSFSPYTC